MQFTRSQLITFVLGLALTASSHMVVAQTPQYSAQGFESPTYVEGTLPGLDLWSGQDGWLYANTDVDLDSTVVQSVTTHGGSQAVEIDAGDMSILVDYCHLRRNTPFEVPLEQPLVVVKLDIMLADGATPSFHWGIDLMSSMTCRAGLWAIRADNRLYTYDGVDWVAPGFGIQRGQWYRSRTEIDFSTDTYTVFIDDVEIASATMPCNGGMYAFTAIYLAEPGDDLFYMDNFEVWLGDEASLFEDGFESGDLMRWSAASGE